VGLFAVHALTRAGLSAEVVDNGIWPCSHSYALALHPSTIQLLRDTGVTAATLDRGCALHTLAFYDGRERRAQVQLNRAKGGPLMVLPQSGLEAALENTLATSDVHVQWRHKVMRVEPAGDHVRVHLNRYEKESTGYVVARTEWVVARSWTVDVPFVIGADGYGSAVRRSIGIEFPEIAPCTWYGVFEFRSDADVPDEVRVVAGERTTDVLWPLGNGWFRWSFQMPDHVDPEVDRLSSYRERYGEPSERTKDRLQYTAGDVNVLPDSELKHLISERAPWFRGAIHEIGWRTVVRFERRLATGFGKGRCWLAGDAAHLGSPISVQSLNMGLLEARDLSDAIRAALRNGGGADMLAAFSNRYMAEWKRLQGVERLVEALPGVDPWVWENRERILSCLPAHHADLTELAGQIGLRV
jgi:NADPH-dependent dioxygenase